MILTEEQKQRITKACVVEYQNDIKDRKKMGQFFTPAELVIRMIEKFDNLDGISCRLSEANENAGAHAADKMKAALVLPKDRAFYTNKKNDKTGQTYWEVSQKTAWGAVKPKHEIGNIKFTTKEERENFYNCMWTTLMRWYWRTQVVDLRNFLQFYPYLDFSHPWTDEMLYSFFGLTEEEIREIEQEIK